MRITLTTCFLIAVQALAFAQSLSNQIAADPCLYSQQQAAVDRWYSDNLALLQDQAYNYASHMPLPDRYLWTEFFRMHGLIQCPETYIEDSGSCIQNPPAYWLRNDMLDSFFLTATANLLLDDNALALLRGIDNNYDQPPLIREQARRLLPTMEFLHVQLVQLRNARQMKLARLENSDDENAKPQKTLAAPAALTAAPVGTVNGIAWSRGRALAIIEGVDDLVQPGDSFTSFTLGRVEVVTIARTSVSFRQGTRTWTQPLGSAPPTAWTVSN
jgi:hypothetical protein